ncbi:hypothetical protein ACE6H2_024461 [Prunus campanulata]
MSLGSTKLVCYKAMCLGTGVPKVKGCHRRHKACMLQGNVLRHGGAEGEGMPNAIQSLHVARHGGAEGIGDAESNTKLACCKVMWLGMRVPKV